MIPLSVLWLIAGVFTSVLFTLVVNPISSLFGFWYVFKLWKMGDRSTIQVIRLSRFRWLPWILVFYFLVRLNIYEYHKYGWINILSIVEVMLVASLILVSAFCFYYYSDTGDLIQEWIAAKTQGICPLITFKEKDNK